MYGKDTTKSTFTQIFDLIFDKDSNKRLSGYELDKYVKKLSSQQLITLLVLSQIHQLSSLREISDSLEDDRLSDKLDLESISHSQISRRLKTLSTNALEEIFHHLTTKVLLEKSQTKSSSDLDRVHLIDSTTISLCLSQFRWAEFRKTKGGIKLHLRLKFVEGDTIPDKAKVTSAKPNDKTQMENMVVQEENVLNVFDRAYVEYRKFDHYTDNNTKFVTRLKDNAVIEVLEEIAVVPGTPIQEEQIVRLGKTITYKTKNNFRLIKVLDTKGKTITIVTNDFNLTAEEIGELYRNRWQIELFFKWMKQHLTIKHFHGKSEQAVKNQIYIALITFCLLKLFQLQAGFRGSMLNLQRLLRTCLYDAIKEFLTKLYSKQTPNQRQKFKPPDLKTEFEIIERQVIAGEADHLDDLTYDPMVL